jgi:hypothetical protein
MYKLCSAIFFASVFSLARDVVGQTWVVQTVDTGGGFNSMVVDNNGNPHISYSGNGDRDLKYARWTGSDWAIQTVDTDLPDGCRYVSIALDSNGYPHISYRAREYALGYAHWTGSGWAMEIVDSIDFIYYTSIALDNNDHPHVSYSYEYPCSLRYARWTGSEWITEIPHGLGGHAAIALDGNCPHIGFIGGGLSYVRWTGSEWAVQIVDSTGEDWNSIALDSNADPHMSYQGMGEVRYARWTGSEWTVQVVDSNGWIDDLNRIAIALDSIDCPHISYRTYRPLAGDVCLKYAVWTGSTWAIDIVDSVGIGGQISIALDDNGCPYISYVGEWDVLKCAYRSTAVKEENSDSGTPESFDLSYSSNPSRSTVTVSYQLSSSSNVSARIYDSAGRVVRDLSNAHQKKGHHTIQWDRKDNGGQEVRSGEYFCELRVESANLRKNVRKLIVLK